MRASVVARRGLVALMNAIPASAAAHFDPSARLARLSPPLANPLLPAAPTMVIVRGGPAQAARLRIDPRRQKFYAPGRYEVAVQETFVRLLRPGATFWVVSADRAQTVPAVLVGRGAW